MGTENNKTTSTGGVSFLGLLTVLFIGLKLTNYIDLSLLWVLTPLWIPFGIFIGFMLIFATLAAITSKGK